jgi:hypothetical protein
MPNHLSAHYAAKRPQCRQQINRLKNICFSLRIIAKEKVKAWGELNIQTRVISEIAESELSEMHNQPIRRNERALTCNGIGRLQVCWQSILQRTITFR